MSSQEPPPSPGSSTDAPAARRAAVVVAGHRGDRGTVDAALSDPDAMVRASAIGAAARLGMLGGDAVADALSDPSAGVRRRAATAAARLGDDASGRALTTALDDPDPTVVETVASALGEREDVPPVAVARLCEVARHHDDSLCREAAVAALGAIGDPAGLAAVLDATADRATVRRRAVLALAAFDGDEVTAALERLVDDRDLQVRQAAEELLAIERGEDVRGPT